MLHIACVYEDRDARIIRGEAPKRTLDVLKVHLAECLNGRRIPLSVTVQCRETGRVTRIRLERLQSGTYLPKEVTP